MSDQKKICTGCSKDGNKTEAKVWCCTCGEIVCTSCAKLHIRLSPPHKMVTLDLIQGSCSDLLTLSKYCPFHQKKKITLYCCQHDELVCYSCVSESHNNCKHISPIEKASENIKTGTALRDIESRMDYLIRFMKAELSIDTDQHQRKEAAKKRIIENISEIKKQIIEHLNDIEGALLIDMENKYGTNKQETPAISQTVIDSFDCWTKGLRSLKEHSTNFHLFQAVKYLDKQVHKHEINIQKFQDLNTSILKFCPSDFAVNYKSLLTSLGTIILESLPSSPIAISPLKMQGQFIRGTVEQRLSLVSSFKPEVSFCDEKIRRCCFISSGRILVIFFNIKSIFCFQLGGSLLKTIQLEFEPSRVTLYDNDQAILSSGKDFIQVINLSDLRSGRKIKVGRSCRGISCRDGKIWVRSKINFLSMLDINGKVSKTITTTFDPWDLCVNQSGSVYFTAYPGNVIYKISPEGEESEVYRHFDLKEPRDLLVDDVGYIYVSGKNSNNIHKISPNGQHMAIVLKEGDGIKKPTGLTYNNITKEFIVLNDGGSSVNIYSVV